MHWIVNVGLLIFFWSSSPGLKPEKVKIAAAGRNHTIVSTG